MNVYMNLYEHGIVSGANWCYKGENTHVRGYSWLCLRRGSFSRLRETFSRTLLVFPPRGFHNRITKRNYQFLRACIKKLNR